MIARILLSILLVTFTVPATYAQSVGGSGSGGGGLRRAVDTVTPRKRGCKEGSRALFYERDTINDQTVSVYRTCQNGSYYDLSDYIYNPKTRCTEGRRELWSERDHSNDRNVYRSMICSNNKWKLVREWY